MAITLTDIRNAAAEGQVSAFVDDSTPAGYFGATAKILGFVTTYLLKGELGDDDAEIVGRIVVFVHADTPKPLCYANGGVLGGGYLGRMESYKEAFEQIVLHSTRN